MRHWILKHLAAIFGDESVYPQAAANSINAALAEFQQTVSREIEVKLLTGEK